jgi:hypothetical protein
MEKMKIWLTRGERDVMTPEPRAFVLDSSVGQDAINEALGLAYTVATDQGTGSRRRAWLDTFDWRLYEAGLVLEHEQTGAAAASSSPAATEPRSPSSRSPHGSPPGSSTFPTDPWRTGSDP